MRNETKEWIVFIAFMAFLLSSYVVGYVNLSNRECGDSKIVECFNKLSVNEKAFMSTVKFVLSPAWAIPVSIGERILPAE